MEDAAGFSVSLARRDDGAVVAVLGGELDQVSARFLKEQLVAAVEPEGTIVVDMSALEFMDSSGLAVLVAVLRQTRDSGGRLIVQDPSPRVAKVITTSSLGELFSIAETEMAPTDDRADRVRIPREPSVRHELRDLLLGYENLLRWGDLTPEQLTFALRGSDLADASADLELADRVRRLLIKLGAAPRPAPPQD